MLISSLLLLGAAGVLAGCNTVQTPPALPTPTSYSLEVPQVPSAVASVQALGGESTLPTATVVTFQPVDVPSAADQSETAQTVQNAQATAGVVRAALPYPIQTNEATVVPARSVLTDAWGSLAVAKVVPLDVDGDHLFILHGVDPGARFVVGAIASRVLESQEPARLVTVGTDDGHITEIASYVGPSPGELAFDGGQALGADTDGEWVVWNERSSVRAYNLTSGVTRLLDERATRNAPYSSFEIPQVDRGVAIWRETRSKADPFSPVRVVPSAVKWADLSTGEVTTLSEVGAYPALSWPIAAWLEYPTNGEGVNDYTIDFLGKVTFRNLESGETWDLPGLTGLAGLALDGDTLFFSTVYGQGFLTNLQGESPRLVAPDYSSPYVSMTLSERIATWKLGATSPVYDRALDRLVYLAGRPLGYPVIRVSNGRALAWEEVVNMVELESKPPGYVFPVDYRVYVVDTSQLPK
ncbi:MAG TPA: hypothetical protein VF826_08145 [Chloroflexia bacterium]